MKKNLGKKWLAVVSAGNTYDDGRSDVGDFPQILETEAELAIEQAIDLLTYDQNLFVQFFILDFTKNEIQNCTEELARAEGLYFDEDGLLRAF